MHCRRVRSFLSAYCNGELSEKRSRAIADHLKACPNCRRDEATSRELLSSIPRMTQVKVSADFNARLMDRLAQERFSETRSKAYLPKKRVPVVSLTRISAVVAAACFVFAFIFAGGIEKFLTPTERPTIAETADPLLNDDYQTVQPQSEHWVFKDQLQRATRIKSMMQRLSGESQFNILTGQQTGGNYNRLWVPIPREFFRMQPGTFQMYNGTMMPETTMVREVNAEG